MRSGVPGGPAADNGLYVGYTRSLRIFGFELVHQVYIASSASVDFDDIVLTTSEPPPARPNRQEEEKEKQLQSVSHGRQEKRLNSV